MKKTGIFLILLSLVMAAQAQKKDSTSTADTLRILSAEAQKTVQKDSTRKKKHDPHKATIYSTILPGAGQVYNGKIWKVPIVYVALGIPAYTFFYNKHWYQQCQYALHVAVTNDTAGLKNISDPNLRTLASYGNDPNSVNAIVNYRDEFRKNQDYSALIFLLFWGLNIVDATVDAHLRDFNVNSDLSFKIKPTFIPGNTYPGISVVFDIHKGRSRVLQAN